MSGDSNRQQGEEWPASVDGGLDGTTSVGDFPAEGCNAGDHEPREVKADAINTSLSSLKQRGRPPTAGKSTSQAPIQVPIEPAIHQQSRSNTRKNLDSHGVETNNSVPTQPIQPANPFFNSSYYEDSDLSEGSIIFQPKTEQLHPAHSSQTMPPFKRTHIHDGRDRLPSYDSVGSSGSVKYVSSNPHATSIHKPPASMQPNNDPSVLLPYPERRKKKQQLQQKQKASDRQKNLQEQSDPRPPAFFLPQGHFYPALSNPYPVMPPYPPADAGVFLGGQQPYLPYPELVAPAHHPPSQNFPSQNQPMPMFLHVPAIPDGSAPYLFPHSMQPVIPSLPLLSPKRPHRPGVRNSSKSSPPHPCPQVPLVRDSTSSSFDTWEGDEMVPFQQKSGDFPPPPPPASNHATHFRQESTGSVSSLGSVDRDDSEHGTRRTSAAFNPFQNRPSGNNGDILHKKSSQFLSTVQERNPVSRVQNAGQSASFDNLERSSTCRNSNRRLHSIDNADWEDENDSRRAGMKNTQEPQDQSDDDSQTVSSAISDDEASVGETADDLLQPNERTRLFPQSSGISSDELYDATRYDRTGAHADKNSMYFKPDTNRSGPVDYGKTARAGDHGLSLADSIRDKASKMRKKDRRGRRSQYIQRGNSSDSSSHTSTSTKDYNKLLKKRAKLLEKERAKLIKQWRAEAIAEEADERRKRATPRWSTRLLDFWKRWFEWVLGFLTWCETFVANLPLTIGAIALAIANLGVDWFKFAEETMDSCEPVHFHSVQCTFPEFPGCFYCDTRARMYRVALGFHWTCNAFAGLLAFGFVAKLLLARRVVLDELSSPTTASPAGLICMTLNVVFAGRGTFGMLMVSLSSATHLCIAIWFIYMALAYQIMPEPSWFPNTTGIGISAVKIWLYYPMVGHFLMAISLTLNFFFFPVSLIRVAMNRKISATIGWMVMSAPNISLYALTIMAQPSFEEEHPDITGFQKMHRQVYLPLMHVLFGLCLLGMVAAVTSLVVRWPEFRKVPFSPAHAAFCCPTLSHVNAIQAYRTAINSFSILPPSSPYRVFIHQYWIICLVAGSILTVVIATKFLFCLPTWTHLDLSDEIEPPAPYETAMSLTNMIATGETLIQSFVSPAILQANETGALVYTRDAQGNQRYVRTRKVAALGFEPIMSVVEVEHEREVLLEWVGQNPPRRSHRSLSVPGIDFSYAQIGHGSGVYGVDEERVSPWISRARRRANTYNPC